MANLNNEEVLFNIDTLSKIISYLPSIDLLSLTLTNKRFGVSTDDKHSLIEDSVRIAIRDIATEEQLAALPRYDGESSLADYHYLQLLRAPLTFDQLVEAKYVDSRDKTCVRYIGNAHSTIETAFSNNLLRAGKHYATFKHTGHNLFVGVMRPGQVNQHTRGYPYSPRFFRNFSQTHVEHYKNSSVHLCLYHSYDGNRYTSNWGVSENKPVVERWDGSENMRSDGDIGLLLDLDEGSLTVYKNGRKLGVMKRGLAGPYCWVVSLFRGVQVTIKRGTVPPS